MYPTALEVSTADAVLCVVVLLMAVGIAIVGDPFIVITKVSVGAFKRFAEVALVET
jgi:hypothetical protein